MNCIYPQNDQLSETMRWLDSLGLMGAGQEQLTASEYTERMPWLEQVKPALELALDIHQNEHRIVNNQPYVNHVLRAAAMVQMLGLPDGIQTSLTRVALLHDSPESLIKQAGPEVSEQATLWEAHTRLTNEAQCTDGEIVSVMTLTNIMPVHDPSEQSVVELGEAEAQRQAKLRAYDNYCRLVKGSGDDLAIWAKLLDLVDNALLQPVTLEALEQQNNIRAGEGKSLKNTNKQLEKFQRKRQNHYLPAIIEICDILLTQGQQPGYQSVQSLAFLSTIKASAEVTENIEQDT